MNWQSFAGFSRWLIAISLCGMRIMCDVCARFLMSLLVSLLRTPKSSRHYSYIHDSVVDAIMPTTNKVTFRPQNNTDRINAFSFHLYAVRHHWIASTAAMIHVSLTCCFRLCCNVFLSLNLLFPCSSSARGWCDANIRLANISKVLKVILDHAMAFRFFSGSHLFRHFHFNCIVAALFACAFTYWHLNSIKNHSSWHILFSFCHSGSYFLDALRT